MSLQNYEQYVLDAAKAFKEELYQEGKAHLDNALALEPTYGKAHNLLGWFYLYHLEDFGNAEVHLKLALKYAKQYSAPYINMIDLLFEAKRLDEHEKLVAEAMKVPGVSKVYLYNELGRNKEVHGKSADAIKYYFKAFRWSMDDLEISIIRDNIRRTRKKRWLFLNI
jgi:tetratricopeptide (TPR) repeat protein